MIPSSGLNQAGTPRILALGLGNLILGDDGVGIHAVRRFKELAPHGVSAFDVGTDVFSAVHLLESADKVIAFDALLGGGEPGSIYLLSGEDVADGGLRGSLHEVGLLSIVRTLNSPQPEVVVIAAEPQVIDFGLELSPALRGAVPGMVRAALALASHWLSCDSIESRQPTDLLAFTRDVLAIHEENFEHVPDHCQRH